MSFDNLNGIFIKEEKISKTTDIFKNNSVNSEISFEKPLNENSMKLLKPIKMEIPHEVIECVPDFNDKKLILLKQIRKDANGTLIVKGGKQHKIIFKQTFVEVIEIESFKEILNKKEEFIYKDKDSCNCTCKIF